MNSGYIVWDVNPYIFVFPEKFPLLGGHPVAWYGLLWAMVFIVGYYLIKRIFKKEGLGEEWADKILMYMLVFTIVGARLGHCLFYEPGYFCTAEHWPEIFLPFNLQTGQFTGYQGLASHGAAIAILFTLWLYCRKYKMNFWWLFDRLVIVVALGGAFIRLGNLFNSEIYGVETSLPWGFIFERNGETVPKHPTQLYEALSYLIIFVVCYIIYCKKNGKLHNGRLFGWWLVALFGMRFLIEFVKEEQVDFEKGMTLDMGQWLSVPFVLGGIVLVVLSHKGILKEGIFTEGHKLKK